MTSMTPDVLTRLHQRIRERTAAVCVIGLGYVGLPLAVELTRAGFPVAGLEADVDRAEALAAGRSCVADVTDQKLRAALGRGFRPTSDVDALSDSEVILITVPTPYTKTKQPDLSYVREAITSIAGHLRPGRLVILESTTYPGTTRELLIPALEATRLRNGKDFETAYSPERIDPGSAGRGLGETPKVVGGATPRATSMSVDLYSSITRHVAPVSSTDVAEMSKLLENTYRHVNIALANEMARLCHELNVDVWEVIEAAATKPFGFAPFYPGPGVGGHCIPIDPYYLTWKAQQAEVHAPLIAEAGRVNDSMPDWVVQRVGDALNGHGKSLGQSRILVIGVTYKRDVADLRESPALRVMKRLRRKGADLVYHDPMVPALVTEWGRLESVELTGSEIERADCVLVLTDHSNVDYGLLAGHARLIFDSRNALAGHPSTNVERL